MPFEHDLDEHVRDAHGDGAADVVKQLGTIADQVRGIARAQSKAGAALRSPGHWIAVGIWLAIGGAIVGAVAVPVVYLILRALG